MNSTKNSPRVNALLKKLEEVQQRKIAKRIAKVKAQKALVKTRAVFNYTPTLTNVYHHTKAAMLEEIEIKTARNRQAAIDASPDLRALQEVRIDSRTKIYVEITKDPEVARNNYLRRINNI